MIQKIFDRYFDSVSFIHHSKKRIAEDNIRNTGDLIIFLTCVCLLLLCLSFLFSGNYPVYAAQIVLCLIAAGIAFFQRVFLSNITESFVLTRIYCFIFYAWIILSYSYVDILHNTESRCIFFPFAMVAFTAVYIDNFVETTWFKIVLTAIYGAMDYVVRPYYDVRKDIMIAVTAVLISCFCYSEIIDLAADKGEDRKKLVQRSTTDLLTGVLNKLSFEERCNEYLTNRIAGAKCVLFIFDLDDFKYVNDHYGHQTGDKVIKTFSHILQGYFHPNDVIGRIGGDEFMVLVMGEMPEGFTERRCRSVLHEFKTTTIDEASGLTCSIGIVEDTWGRNFTQLYHAADEALYKAKKSGKAKFCISESAL